MKVSFIAVIVVSKIVHSFYCQVVLRSNSNLDDKGIDNRSYKSKTEPLTATPPLRLRQSFTVP